LDGERTGLFFEFVRIVQEFQSPWFVFENVPGLFSSNERRDFARVIGELGQCGYFLAYRVLDSHLTINGITPGNNMEQPSFVSNFNTSSTFKYSLEVIGTHQSVVSGNGYHSPVVHGAYMPPGDTNIG